jgi:PAS domain S-box-containing protein
VCEGSRPSHTLQVVVPGVNCIARYGYSAAEAIGRPIVMIYPPESHQARQEMLARLRRDGSAEAEMRLRHASGKLFYGQISLTQTRDQEGRPSGIFGFTQDVSGRVMAEEALRQSEERRSLALRAANLGVWEANHATGVLVANRRWAEILGYDQDEVVYDAKAWEELFHPDDLPLVQRIWQEHLEGRSELYQVESRLRRRDGAWVWMQSMGKIMERDDQGRVTRAVGVAADIQARRAAEEALQAANQRLEEALDELRQAQERIIQNERLRALGQMASGIAHDLNNALTPIMGFADLLMLRVDDGFQPDELRQYLKLISTAARDAAAIVRRMRDFYRPKHTGEELIECDLALIAQEAMRLTEPLWQDTAQVQGRQIQAIFECPAPLPKVPVLISEVREGLINLLLNAVDAMPHGGTLRVLLTRRRGQALLTVSDSGVGMSDEVLARCIEPFFTTKGTRGSGLGLAMVHGCMQRHGGTLEISSQATAGSAFTMVFPLPAGAAAELSPMDTPPPNSLLPPLEGLRILLVDDEPQVRATLAMLLEVDNHEVTMADSGAEALRLFDLPRHQLVITDRAMPGMTGDQLAWELKARAPTLPILMVTGFGGLMQSSQEQPQGVEQVLSKPVTLDKLRGAIRRTLRQL